VKFEPDEELLFKLSNCVPFTIEELPLQMKINYEVYHFHYHSLIMFFQHHYALIRFRHSKYYKPIHQMFISLLLTQKYHHFS
jgi:hypothetical protein